MHSTVGEFNSSNTHKFKFEKYNVYTMAAAIGDIRNHCSKGTTQRTGSSPYKKLTVLIQVAALHSMSKKRLQIFKKYKIPMEK